MALYEAKYKGKNRYAVFDPRMNSRTWERLELETDLRRALDSNEFSLAYQPVLELETGIVSEVEALLRWDHPKRGVLQPAQFLPLAEETGLLIPIGMWVLHQACQQAQEWRKRNTEGPGFAVSVNLSARQFRHPMLVEHIAQILKETQLESRLLKLEVAEYVMMEHVDSTVGVLRELKAWAFRSLSMISARAFPRLVHSSVFHSIRSRSIVRLCTGLGRNAEDSAIVRAVVAFAMALGVDVIAEGIETTAQLRELRDLGCRYGQGFYYVKPLAVDAIDELSATRRIQGQNYGLL